MNKKHSITKKLAFTALMTAFTMLATLLIRIPLPLGYVHLGDGFVFLSVFLLGPLWGTIASGVGSGLADVFGYITYAPATLLVKSLMAICAWFVYHALKKLFKKPLFSEIIAGAVGSVVMAFGYFLFESFLYATVGVAIVNVPWNILQGVVGILVSTAIMRALSATKLLDKLL